MTKALFTGWLKSLSVKRDDGYLLVSEAAFEAELRRIIGRTSHGKKDARREMVENIVRDLSQLFSSMGTFLDRFTNLLEIATFTVKAEE